MMTSTFAEALAALNRSVELSILVKATLLLLAGLAATAVARRAQASVRHLLVAATFAALLALPLLVAAGPRVVIELPVAATTGSTPVDAATPAANVTPASSPSALPTRDGGGPAWSAQWPAALRVAWIAGIVWVLASLLFALWRVGRIRRQGLPRHDLGDLTESLARSAGIDRAIDVLEHETVMAPLTCGVRRAAIVLPRDARDWSDEALRRALVHELEHIRRRDWMVQLAARVACACYWFHPLAWMAWRRLCLEAERACDDAVVGGAERTDYADQLVTLARRLSINHAPAVLGMANRSDLSARVAALLDGSRPRGRAGVFAAASVVLAATLVVIAIAPLGAIAGGTAEQRARSSQSGRVRGLDRALYEAAEQGEVADIDDLLRAGADVNAAIDGDGSPLIGAAREGHLMAVRHLLDRGADPNLAVPGDGNPLIMAAREGHVAVVAMLLDRGADVDRVVEDDENALIQASGSGHLDVVKLLVARGANVNAAVWAESARERPRGEWRTPLGMARRGGHQAVVAFLIASGARDR